MRKTNDEIINEIRLKAKSEQRLTLEVIELIKEVEVRKLHLPLGFASVFEFVTKDLRYEPGSAMRRIQAARLLRDVPEVKEKIKDGTLSLTVISQVQSFLKKESVATRQRPSKERKVEILKLVENKSSREAEKEFVKLCPEAARKPESQRELSENLTEFKLVMDAALVKELEELKLLFSHQNPNLSYVELIRIMAKKVRTSLARKPKTTPTPESKGPVTRHIPNPIRRFVWARDKGCCQYVDRVSGRQCSSRYQLQIDHVKRFSDGGSHEASNLRLYCAAHNGHRG